MMKKTLTMRWIPRTTTRTKMRWTPRTTMRRIQRIQRRTPRSQKRNPRSQKKKSKKHKKSKKSKKKSKKSKKKSKRFNEEPEDSDMDDMDSDMDYYGDGYSDYYRSPAYRRYKRSAPSRKPRPSYMHHPAYRYKVRGKRSAGLSRSQLKKYRMSQEARFR